MRPTELFPRPSGIAEKNVDLGRTKIVWVDLDEHLSRLGVEFALIGAAATAPHGRHATPSICAKISKIVAFAKESRLTLSGAPLSKTETLQFLAVVDSVGSISYEIAPQRGEKLRLFAWARVST